MNQDDSKNVNHSKKRVVPIDPLEVTESLGFQTYRKGARKPWTREEDSELANLVSTKLKQNGDIELIDWEKIADKMSPDGSRKSKDCRKRWSNSLDPALRKGKWTPEEDELLVKAFQKFGSAWLKVAQEIKGRTDDQCAKRYVEVLDPKTKDRLKPWTEEEDLLLIKQVKLYGTKWRTICSAFESRPSLTCRNRWRKLVTEVVRGKASPKIKEEVESVTNGNSSSVLDTLNRQQEELTKTNVDSDSKRSIKRRKPNAVAVPVAGSQTLQNHSRLSTKSEIEWVYSVNPGMNDHYSNTQSKPPFGTINNRETVRHLVEYAKANGVGISIHQHIHHHYTQGSHSHASGNELTSPGSSTSGTNMLEPEEQVSRFQHFNYLPPMTETPKLNSSTDQPSKNDTTQHHHHHHHHHHHTERGSGNQQAQRTKLQNITSTDSSDSVKESNLQRLLNAEEYSGHQSSSTPNPLTPLTQAVEMVRAADAANFAGTSNYSSNDFGIDQKSQLYGHQSNGNQGADLWQQTKTVTSNGVGIQPQSNSARNERKSSSHSQASSQHQDHLRDFAHPNVPKNNPLPYVGDSSLGDNTRSNFSSAYSEGINEQEDGEEELLARELEETGIDEDVLNSYGLFYNVYTKEGSTFPDAQPNQQPQSQNAYRQNENSYDQWGSDFIIPFNPS
ncbi:BAS1 [Candida margitis]|uniref:BAS1 n=1 Tax=Candida margitis TaxID=1775924 RepID=UPI0022270DBA|nr:BAS1 [Candida margitis]KAI5967863.1 BAS1 [Candida margitis]